MPIGELTTEAMCTFSEAAGMPVYAIDVQALRQTLRSSPRIALDPIEGMVC